MKIAVYSAHPFEIPFLEAANAGIHELEFISTPLTETNTALAAGCEAICIFTGDHATAVVLKLLHSGGVRYLALRSAGFNHVDLAAAKALGLQVARVSAYSPEAIAEHATALILALNRKLIQAHNRVMDANFSLDGLTGFNLHGKTVGIIGAGKIGSAMVRIMYGFGCRVLICDEVENQALKDLYEATYASLDAVCREAQIISLHLPLVEATRHMIGKERIELMQPGVMLINTSRGGLVHSKEVIDGLKNGRIGYFGMDVYEEEDGLFFEDHSGEILQDDVLARLMTFKNVLITSHQGFLTDTALENIAATTLENIAAFDSETSNENFLT